MYLSRRLKCEYVNGFDNGERDSDEEQENESSKKQKESKKRDRAIACHDTSMLVADELALPETTYEPFGYMSERCIATARINPIEYQPTCNSATYPVRAHAHHVQEPPVHRDLRQM